MVLCRHRHCPKYHHSAFSYFQWGEYATLRCDNEECPGIYVTEICCGDPGYNCGKFHNHCTACPMFGMCIGKLAIGGLYFLFCVVVVGWGFVGSKIK